MARPPSRYPPDSWEARQPLTQETAQALNAFRALASNDTVIPPTLFCPGCSRPVARTQIVIVWLEIDLDKPKQPRAYCRRCRAR